VTEEYGHISDAFDNLPEEELLISEQNKKALEALGIDYENFGQKPWDENDLEPTGDIQQPNGDFLKNYPDVTRVEVITSEGREFVRYECSNVQVSLQDDGQTLKVFLFTTYD
jgi:hypothetical protein